MNENKTPSANATDAAGSKEALRGWIVLGLLVAVVLVGGYFYTH
ncbi:hypothetical protein WHT83_01380 [Aminobacter sp. P9b]|uniref:Uncharacterized protein n=1 Tax=Aminobacter niigataensis TaxID=83265 RepID=A0ABR6L1I1_9HYPH|nr:MULTISPECIES: hypothetical protein [Aminobacter]AWC22082.1 hypothetical protein CO731_01538 [Aminobacter sp. MSH1]MBB4650488.1 hypothetical protein [Aminobacter niigataensis]